MSLTPLYRQLSAWFPTALWRGDPTRREIALTYDDGPDPKTTPALLEVLDHFAIRATFFQVGERAQRAPQLVRQAAEAGHQLGLHGYHHKSFVWKRDDILLRELARAQQVLAQASGLAPADLTAVRPPYGQFTPRTLKTLRAAGYLPTMWSVVPFHWRQSLDATLREVRRTVRNGAIVVLHEGLAGPTSTELTDALLPYLLAEGYSFVTIAVLWAGVNKPE